MMLGYARVSSLEQNLNLQYDALKLAGCERIFEDILSGMIKTRPGLQALLEHLRPGDSLVVWRLDRLGRSTKELLSIIENLEKNKVAFKSLSESIDTTSSTGKLVFTMFAAIAEFERNLIRERTYAGLQAARSRGRKGGRKASISRSKIDIAVHLANTTDRTIKDICDSVGISVPTYYRLRKLVIDRDFKNN